jgi:large subunit ribosomal protein L22
MEFQAVHRFAAISPTKVRPTIELIRGRSVDEALEILAFTPTRAAKFVDKVLRSAVANAALDADPDDLYVSTAQVDTGPTRRGLLPRARGRADRIRHRTSHIRVVLSDERPLEEE